MFAVCCFQESCLRLSATLILILSAGIPGPAAGPKPNSEIEAFAATLLEPGRKYANVEPAEAAYLRDRVKEVNAKRVLEVGTSTGYSGIWMAMALRETGGRLITLEIDPGRHRTALENFTTAGLANLVEARLGDALQEIPKISGPLDVVFIDALKSDYLKYYELSVGKVRKGGLIIAHNVKSHPRDMSDFLERIQNDPRVETKIVTPGWQGFSVSRVK
jgi:predicted O-methyltransferase YrrM